MPGNISASSVPTREVYSLYMYQPGRVQSCIPGAHVDMDFKAAHSIFIVSITQLHHITLV